MAEKTNARKNVLNMRVRDSELVFYQRAQELAGYYGDAEWYRYILSCVSGLAIKYSFGDMGEAKLKEMLGELIGNLIRDSIEAGSNDSEDDKAMIRNIRKITGHGY